MKTWYRPLFTVLLTLGLLAGCSGEETKKADKPVSPETEQTEAFPVTVEDAAGEKVTIGEEPEKIVSLIPSNTEIAFELGLGEQIAGVSDFDTYPAEAAAKEKIGGIEFNVEKIISLGTDLVLAHESTLSSAGEGLQQMRDAGIKVLVVNDAADFESVYESIDMIGRAAGANEKAEKLIEDMKAKVQKISDKAASIKEEDRKKVLVEVAGPPEIYVTGKNTFIDEMLQVIHADNAAGDLEGWAKMEEESIISINPGVIITTYGRYVDNVKESILQRDGWETVKAVKEKQVADVDEDLVTRSGPRITEGVEELAKAIYPDVFK